MTSRLRPVSLSLLAALGALVVLPPSTSAAAPEGAITEIPIHSNVVDIAPGPEGDLWFSENLRERRIGKIAPDGKVTKFKMLPKGVEPGGLVAGPDGNVWFTFEGGGFASSGGGIGRITPKGAVTLFPEPSGLSGSPFEIIAGPDGDLWFDHAAIFTPTGQTIGRITTSGQISEFSAGLTDSSAVTNLTAGTDGNVWFADESSNPAIGRITPEGQITEFSAGLAPDEYPIIFGPEPAADGNLFFSANQPHRIAVEQITSAGEISRPPLGLDPKTFRVGPFTVAADGNLWFRVERHRPPVKTDRVGGPTAIARMTPSGKVTEFSRCLRQLPEFAGPEGLTEGPGGDIWFNTRISGESAHSNVASTPAIGRITPDGQITEYRYGLNQYSEPDNLTIAGGSVWLIDRRSDSIAELKPTNGPANTFLSWVPYRHKQLLVETIVPGPGRIQIKETGVITHGHREYVPGLVWKTIEAPACGPATTPLLFAAKLQQLLDRRHTIRLALLVTFTPRGGRPFSQRISAGIEAG
jgi:virginiamycin B lyase